MYRHRGKGYRPRLGMATSKLGFESPMPEDAIV